MRGYFGSLVTVVVMLLGCPSEFGKDGRVNKAVHKDSLELVREECDPVVFDEWCDGGRENTPECIEACT